MRLVSCLQPSSVPHLGNYLGALQPWTLWKQKLQRNDKMFLGIADGHALTTHFNTPHDWAPHLIQSAPISVSLPLHERVLYTAATLMALDLTTPQCHLFLQSSIPAHTELMWLLSCITPVSQLNKMTQYKTKKSGGEATLGLLSYPVLQAADVLLYRGTHVPVGEDQIQHLELIRILAKKMNTIMKEDTFPIPDTCLSLSPRIMTLTDPTMKMSKSCPSTMPPHRHALGTLFLTDSPDEIQTKIMAAMTDSISGPLLDQPEERPGVSNLIRIFKAVSDSENTLDSTWTIKQLKEAVIQQLVDKIVPIGKRIKHLLKEERELIVEELKKGTEMAREEAVGTMALVREKIQMLDLEKEENPMMVNKSAA